MTRKSEEIKTREELEIYVFELAAEYRKDHPEKYLFSLIIPKTGISEEFNVHVDTYGERCRDTGKIKDWYKIGYGL